MRERPGGSEAGAKPPGNASKAAGLARVEAKSVPLPIGPYSQAVTAGSFVFVSGQVGIDASGKLVEGGVVAQAEKILGNIAAILGAAGYSLSSVVKCEIYLKDMADFKAVNEVYARHFSAEPRPARQTMQVAALPMGALIEVSCIAFRGKN